jgi:hypothetical protein
MFLKCVIHIQETKTFLPVTQSARTWDSHAPPGPTRIIQSAKYLHSLIIVDRLNKRQKRRLGRAIVLAIVGLLPPRQKRVQQGTGPEGFRRLGLPDFKTIGKRKC